MVDVLGLKRWQLEGVVDPYGKPIEEIDVPADHVVKLAENYLKKRSVPTLFA